jgi:hypothetical protein
MNLQCKTDRRIEVTIKIRYSLAFLWFVQHSDVAFVRNIKVTRQLEQILKPHCLKFEDFKGEK